MTKYHQSPLVPFCTFFELPFKCKQLHFQIGIVFLHQHLQLLASKLKGKEQVCVTGLHRTNPLILAHSYFLFQVSPEIAALGEPFVQLPFDAGDAIQKTSVRRRSTSFSQIVHGHYAIMFLYECSITLNSGFCHERFPT